MKCFNEYRDTMLGIIADAERNLTTECPADTAALDHCRVRMARIITAYHLFADRELFTPCLSAGDPAQRNRVRAVAADCAALANDFRAYTRACAVKPAHENWAGYRLRAFAMITRVRRHLLAAEQEVRECEILPPSWMRDKSASALPTKPQMASSPGALAAT